MTFGMRNLGHTRLFGAFLANHAIRDGICFLHGGEGCKTKTQLHLFNHDWAQESHNRRIWTDIRDVDLIEGTGERLEQMVTTWVERRRPGVVFVLSVTFVEVSGEDVPAVVRRLDEELDCPVIHVPVPGFEGDLFSGYSQLTRAVLERVDWSGQPEPNMVNLVGHFFDRYEEDRLADLAELRRLLEGAGLRLRSTFLGGEPVADLMKAGDAALNVLLPMAHHLADDLEKLSGRPSVCTDLPLGLKGTSQWVHTIAAAVPGAEAMAEVLLDAELSRVVPLLAPFADRLRDGDEDWSAAVCADTPLAAGLAAFLADLGIRTELVALLDASLGGEQAFSQAFDRLAPEEALQPSRILHHPERSALVQAMKAGPKPRLLLGSTVEIDDLKDLAIPSIEVGFPSTSRHGLFPMPVLGFNGATALTMRILQALSGVF